MKRFFIFFFTFLISFINTNGIYKIHSHSGSWCDYETKLGKVNIQVIKENDNSENFAKFKMTLIDGDKNEYSAECEIMIIVYLLHQNMILIYIIKKIL